LIDLAAEGAGRLWVRQGWRATRATAKRRRSRPWPTQIRPARSGRVD